MRGFARTARSGGRLGVAVLRTAPAIRPGARMAPFAVLHDGIEPSGRQHTAQSAHGRQVPGRLVADLPASQVLAQGARCATQTSSPMTCVRSQRSDGPALPHAIAPGQPRAAQPVGNTRGAGLALGGAAR
ncbi:hypothetical protein Veis_1131 [Verminephrobacter eiseniae EF01-2]|uniref:Uncharacterized protein n=1 Tax=Verminephrobacter eiseniae (strain EF01-2) TaxID=391735 RepID=A1WGZ6_VEREI|nr:hypothetical protein Veis_1131 [Verminephrobacter eiseniae EF01-2]